MLADYRSCAPIPRRPKPVPTFRMTAMGLPKESWPGLLGA